MRTEHDLLGILEVSDNVYYGVHTLRALNNFKISDKTIADLPEIIYGIVVVKKATAITNNQLGVLEDKLCQAIVTACDSIIEKIDKDPQWIAQNFPIDIYQGGAGTSTNMNANEVIANLALETLGLEKGQYSIINPNDHVNMSQSTNDAYPTAVRIALILGGNSLITHLEKLRDAFEQKELEFSDVYKMGRTELQDAVPMTLGQEFSAYKELMSEEILFIQKMASLLHEMNLGATAIGTGINAPKGFAQAIEQVLSEVTGMVAISSPNLIEATSDTGAYVSFSLALKRLAIKLLKICNDLRLLSSGPRAGFNDINLPEVQAGSSIMPGKINPVIPEVIGQICFKVIGNDLTVCEASASGQLQLNYAEPVMLLSLFESIHLLENGIDTLREKCVVGITANQEVTENYVKNSIGLITFLNRSIGHDKADEVAKICLATGKSVREIILEKELMSEEELDEILDFKKMV